jgi:hypothetical protein
VARYPIDADWQERDLRYARLDSVNCRVAGARISEHEATG